MSCRGVNDESLIIVRYTEVLLDAKAEFLSVCPINTMTNQVIVSNFSSIRYLFELKLDIMYVEGTREDNNKNVCLSIDKCHSLGKCLILKTQNRDQTKSSQIGRNE